MGLVHFGDHPFDAKLIVFDKDGTLFDFGATWKPRFLAAIDLLGRRFPNRAEICAALHRTLGYDVDAKAFDELGPFATATSEAVIYAATTVLFQLSAPRQPWADCERLVRQNFAPALAVFEDPVPTTDLAGLFVSLREIGTMIAVITNDDSGPTGEALGKFGLAGLVDFVATGDGPYRPKPAEEMLLAGAEGLGVPLENTAVVGDSLIDLDMARAAGAGLRVGVLTGIGSLETLLPSADLVLSSVADIRVGINPGDESSLGPAHL